MAGHLMNEMNEHMYMQETLHVWYLSSAALVLKACDDLQLAMGN